jgi:hypothetical protein
MRRSDELTKDWKVTVRADVAGAVEFVLTDPLTNAPIYGARTKLITQLLEHWLDFTAGRPPDERKPLPTLEELRDV